MTHPDELTPQAAPIPMWIESAVTRAMGRALEAIDESCAAREARMEDMDRKAAEREDRREKRILEALGKLGVARLELAQKATEAAVHALSHKAVILREEIEELRAQVESLEQWRRDTEPCPPPNGGE